VSAVAITAAVAPPDRTIATVAAPVQSLMSITVPFLGILLTSELHREDPRGRIVPKLVAATCLAVAFALLGTLVSAIAITLAPAGAGQGRWDHVGAIAVGGVLVQVTAQFVGTGLGMLVRSPLVAIIASVALPLGLWLILSAADRSGRAQAWLTPYASARNLLAGEMDAESWARSTVVVLIWVVGLNTAGAIRVMRRRN
jgi:hypothetical protein